MKRIVVIGSINMDSSLHVDHIPVPGETIIAKTLKMCGGGKGANQAMCIAKLGGHVAFVGRVGDDEAGKQLYSQMKNAGIDMRGVFVDPVNSTGIANILVSDNGENNIVVCPGANGAIDRQQIDACKDLIREADYCILQLEIPMDVVIYAVDICEQENVCCILNPAPAVLLPHTLLAKIKYLIPNETELLILSDVGHDYEKSAQKLLETGVVNMLVTLGRNGCMLVNQHGTSRYPIIEVEVVDTTAAGDSFIGGFVQALAEGLKTDAAIYFATCTASITISKYGAYTSLPSRAEVDRKLSKIKGETIHANNNGEEAK